MRHRSKVPQQSHLACLIPGPRTYSRSSSAKLLRSMSRSLSPSRTEHTPHPCAVGHFLRQVETHHVQTPNHTPLPLHYDSTTASMVVFPWCAVNYSAVDHYLTRAPNRRRGANRPYNPETEARVPPSGLEAYRRTHHFKGPCCLCAFVTRKPYIETRIGIVESFNGDEDRNRSVLHGEYVATCATQTCGYFREHSLLRFPLGNFYLRVTSLRLCNSLP
jgi:hypothetical protein